MQVPYVRPVLWPRSLVQGMTPVVVYLQLPSSRISSGAITVALLQRLQAVRVLPGGAVSLGSMSSLSARG